MKRYFLLLIAAFLLAITANARTYALVVGISNYHDGINDVQWTTASAKKFASMLKAHTKDVSILTSKYATGSNILSKLGAIAKSAGADDRIIFFYSGHGETGGLATPSGILPYDQIIKVLASSKAKYKFCFIEACHSGSVAASAPNSPGWHSAAKKNNIVFFTGCRPEESSMVSATIGSGLFSQALIKGLRGKADYNRDKGITVLELFKYTFNDVVQRAKAINAEQHPQLIGPKALQDVVILKW